MTDEKKIVIKYQEESEDTNSESLDVEAIYKEYSKPTQDRVEREFLDKIQSYFETDMDRDVFNRLPLSDSQKVEILMGIHHQKPLEPQNRTAHPLALQD